MIHDIKYEIFDSFLHVYNEPFIIERAFHRGFGICEDVIYSQEGHLISSSGKDWYWMDNQYDMRTFGDNQLIENKFYFISNMSHLLYVEHGKTHMMTRPRCIVKSDRLIQKFMDKGCSVPKAFQSTVDILRL